MLYESEIGSLALVFEYMDVNLYEFLRDHKNGYDESTGKCVELFSLTI